MLPSIARFISGHGIEIDQVCSKLVYQHNSCPTPVIKSNNLLAAANHDGHALDLKECWMHEEIDMRCQNKDESVHVHPTYTTFLTQ